MGRAVRGDFGISYKYKMDVLEVIEGRVGNTLLLGGVGFVLIFVLALLLGIWCAWNEERLIDRAICKIGTVTSCIPEFWLSLVLILIFAVELKVLPSSGAYTIGKENDLGDRILHLILPMTVVVLGHLWYYAYFGSETNCWKRCAQITCFLPNLRVLPGKVLCFVIVCAISSLHI